MVDLKTLTSRATKWGVKITKLSLERLILNKRERGNAGFTDQIFLLIGGSPDGIIKYRWHFPGFLT